MSNKIIHPLTILNSITPKMLFGLFFNEIKYLKKFRRLLTQLHWDDLDIKTGGYAANGSFLYFLLKVYTQIKPERILELGSGQTTKILCRYIAENKETSSVILEDNLEWYKNHKTVFSQDRVSYDYSPLINITIDGNSVKWYDYTFSEITESNKFNLIIIDGPKGTNYYSRGGILHYLLDIIDLENFILIFDDTSRKGEIETINLTKKMFEEKGVNFQVKNLYGSKKQTCFYSNTFNV